MALYGLIERKWAPKSTEIDDGVIECLGFVLSSLHAVTVSRQEKEQVVAAVIALLRLSAESGKELSQKVFKCMLYNLERLGKLFLLSRSLCTSTAGQSNLAFLPSGQMQEPQEKEEDEQAQYKEVLLATLQSICDVLLLIESSSYDHHRYRTRSLYHSEITSLIFGSAFADGMAGGKNKHCASMGSEVAGAVDGSQQIEPGVPVQLPEGFNALVESVYHLKRARHLHGWGFKSIYEKVLKNAQEYFGLTQRVAMAAAVDEAEPNNKRNEGVGTFGEKVSPCGLAI